MIGIPSMTKAKSLMTSKRLMKMENLEVLNIRRGRTSIHSNNTKNMTVSNPSMPQIRSRMTRKHMACEYLKTLMKALSVTEDHDDRGVNSSKCYGFQFETHSWSYGMPNATKS